MVYRGNDLEYVGSERVRGLPLITNTPGKIFYVDPRGPQYGSGSDTQDGSSWGSAFATIQAAVNACVSKRGDVIFVGPAASAANTTYFPGTTSYPDYRKIKENVFITKDNVHIFAVPFKSAWSHQIRASDGAGANLETHLGSRTVYPISLYAQVVTDETAFVVCARDVEIAGFCIDVGGGEAGIYIGDGDGVTGSGLTSATSAGTWIHDNYICGGSEGT